MLRLRELESRAIQVELDFQVVAQVCFAKGASAKLAGQREGRVRGRGAVPVQRVSPVSIDTVPAPAHRAVRNSRWHQTHRVVEVSGMRVDRAPRGLKPRTTVFRSLALVHRALLMRRAWMISSALRPLKRANLGRVEVKTALLTEVRCAFRMHRVLMVNVARLFQIDYLADMPLSGQIVTSSES